MNSTTTVETITLASGAKATMTTTVNNAPRKRVRASKTRDARFRSLCSRISSAYRDAVQTFKPMHDVFAMILKEISEADLQDHQKEALSDRHWAVRDFVELTNSRWQLYLPLFEEGNHKSIGSDTLMTTYKKGGVEYSRWWIAVTSDQVSALREAGDENVWQRIHGRMEWKDARKPFYENQPPQPLSSEQQKKGGR